MTTAWGSLTALVVFLTSMGTQVGIRAQEATPQSPASVVKTKVYASLDPVPRGKEFQVAVVVEIASGYHMNSHKPLDSYLIPTTLTPQLPAGLTLVDTIYPAGKNLKFPFSPDKPLNVYTESVTLRMRLTAGESAALGQTSVPMTLRYQACNNSACLPPVKVPVTAEIKVAAAGTSTRAEHPEIFSASSK
ncbi:MAG TPA: protein-disulfide reductase DsbD domain-containing protein [Candidatus Acidoferrales bacterium]|nr:protein-disulfide reductase DsbD domain-containing protein [Candidatus Acidoferrales bacterium]